MCRNWDSSARGVAVAILLLTMCVSGAWAQKYKVLHNFVAPDGFTPYSGLTFDKAGNIYGTTSSGGTDHLGTVFQMKPNPDGTWSESLIHDFTYGEPAGASPRSGVILDPRGNLYSTTSGDGSLGCGGAFELTPGAGGQWTISTLHAFDCGLDGGYPVTGLALGNAENAYGATEYGGANNQGVVYELAHVSVFNWYELVLHSFGGGTDGIGTASALVLDGSGNLYGTTSGGGIYGRGTVFKLTPNQGRTGWTETVLYSFTGGNDGGSPDAGLVFDTSGNLYGTTVYGGGCGGGYQLGVAFKLAPNSDGTWSESVMHAFGCTQNDAAAPDSSLTFDKAGNLYGEAGGGPGGGGSVFKLTPSSGGQWTESVVYNFTGGLDGGYPFGGLTLDGSGNIYGTTVLGGIGGEEEGGVVFEVTP